MRKILIILFLSGVSTVCHGQAWSGILYPAGSSPCTGSNPTKCAIDWSGAGSGGGGGVVILSSQSTVTTWPTINTSGGAGGTCGAFTTCGTGGAGGAGWSAEFQGW